MERNNLSDDPQTNPNKEPTSQNEDPKPDKPPETPQAFTFTQKDQTKIIILCMETT